jgi:hypothetical protein
MFCIVVDSSEVIGIQKEIESKNDLKLGAVSNAGLPAGKLRLTFLPKEAFEPVNTNNEAIDGALKQLLTE